MKKTGIVVALVLSLVVAFGVAGYAYAQTTPDTPYGGMMGGRGAGGHMGGMMGQTGVASPLHDYMVSAMAESLGLSVEDLQARIDSGETMYDIAASQGLSTEEFYTLMQTTRSQALEQAVADGVITSEQAEWMNSRMGQMHNRSGAGDCHADGTGRGPRGARGGRGMMGTDA